MQIIKNGEINMNKSKILGAVITASAEMTDLYSEISHNVISDNMTSSNGKSEKSSKIKSTKKIEE